MRLSLFTNENRWFVDSDNRFHNTSQDIYGPGTATPASSAVGSDYDFVRLHETVYRRVKSAVWAGGGVLLDSHTNVGPVEGAEDGWPSSPYVTYSQSHDLPLDGQQSLGVSANVLVNTRDADLVSYVGAKPRTSSLCVVSTRAALSGKASDVALASMISSMSSRRSS